MKSTWIGAALAAATVVGCGSMGHKESGESKERKVTIDQVSPPAKATIDREAPGAQIEKITREIERGRDVYDVEATVGGQHKEWVIAHDTGEVLGREVPIDYGQVPQAVRAAAQKHFGTSQGLTAMKCQEYGETKYEVEGMRNGKRHEMSFDEMGKPAD